MISVEKLNFSRRTKWLLCLLKINLGNLLVFVCCSGCVFDAISRVAHCMQCLKFERHVKRKIMHLEIDWILLGYPI